MVLCYRSNPMQAVYSVSGIKERWGKQYEDNCKDQE